MADDFLTEFIDAGGPDIGHLTGVFQFIVNQDLTPLSEPERATFLERAHRALGLPPESGTIVPMKGQFKIRGEVVEALRPYVNLEGLNKLAVRYGASTRLLSTEYGAEGAVVRMRAEIPGGRFRERETLCTNDEAAEEGRPAIDIASERAERQVLYGLLGLPEPTLGRGGLRFPGSRPRGSWGHPSSLSVQPGQVRLRCPILALPSYPPLGRHLLVQMQARMWRSTLNSPVWRPWAARASTVSARGLCCR